MTARTPDPPPLVRRASAAQEANRPMTIWHYTCGHGAGGIRREGIVKPNPHPFLNGLPISWWTDLGPEHRFEVGLTSTTLGCDRMANRFQVKDPDDLDWWPHLARYIQMPRSLRDELEAGRLPAHWWCSLEPVEVIA